MATPINARDVILENVNRARFIRATKNFPGVTVAPWANAIVTLNPSQLTTTVSGSITNPYGTAATKYTPTVVNSTHIVSTVITTALVSGGNYQITHYVKDDGSGYRTLPAMGARNTVTSVTSYALVQFNPSTGTFSGLAGGAGWSNLYTTYYAVGNGWWKVIMGGTFTVSTGGETEIFMNLQVWNNVGAQSYAGDGVSGPYVYGIAAYVNSKPDEVIGDTYTDTSNRTYVWNGVSWFQGALDAKSIRLSSDKQLFTYDGTGAVSPAGQVIAFTVSKQNTTATTTWSTSPAVNLYNASTGGSIVTTGDTVYMRIADYGANTAVTVTASLTDGAVLTDTTTVVRLQAGSNSIVGFLTNEAALVAAASNGTGYSLTTSGGTFKVFNGNTDVTNTSTFGVGTAVGTASLAQNGLTLTINTATGVYSLAGASWTTDSETFNLLASFSGVTITKSYKITKAKAGATGAAGAAAISVLLSNEAVVLAADTAGTVASYAGSGTEIRVYEGTTELVYDGVGTTNSTWTVTSAATSITRGTITDSGNFATVGVHSAMTADIATITYTISGRSSLGTTFSINKIQSFSKARAGAQGIQGTAGTPGTAGTRGTVQVARVVTGSTWSDTEANTAITIFTGASTRITGDIVTLYNTAASYSEAKTWNGTAWTTLAAYFNGSLVVDGSIIGDKLAANTVTANEIDTRQLTVKDAAGNVLFGAGTNLDYTNIDSDPAWQNENIYVTSDGVIASSISTQPNDPKNLLNYDTFSTLSGGWLPLEGVAGESFIAFTTSSFGPKGIKQNILQAVNSGTTGSLWDGGFFAPTLIPTASTRYRIVVPFKRITSTAVTGTAYFGIAPAFPTAGQERVFNQDGTTTNNNPYFAGVSVTNFVANEWYIVVGYIFPTGSTGVDAQVTDAGVWRVSDGTKLASASNYVFTTSGNSLGWGLRAGQNNVTTVGQNVQFSMPFVHAVDGTEPELWSMFRGQGLRSLGFTGDVAATNDLQLSKNSVMLIEGNSAKKLSSNALWDGAVWSRNSYKDGAYVSFTVDQTNTAIMVGLNTDPTTNNSHETIDYAWYLTLTGTLECRASGSIISGSPTTTTRAIGDVLSIQYDGSKVLFLKNNTVIYTHTTSVPVGATMYLDSSFYSVGGSVSGLRFGPLSNNNWVGIGGARPVQFYAYSRGLSSTSHPSGYTLGVGNLDTATHYGTTTRSYRLDAFLRSTMAQVFSEEYSVFTGVAPTSNLNNLANALTYSEDFSNVIWLSDNPVVTRTLTAGVVLEDGSTGSVMKITENTTSSTQSIYQAYALSVAATPMLAYFDLKAGERSFAQVTLGTSGVANGARMIVDLSTGTISTAATLAGTATGLVSSVTALGNGWYRCAIGCTFPATATIYAGAYIRSTNSTAAYVGTTGSGIYIRRAQLEYGTTVSKYRATTTSARYLSASALAEDLNSLTSANLVVVTTYDDPSVNRLTGGLESAMYRCGASQQIFGNTSNFKARGAYILIGVPDSGEGNGYESYAGSITNDPDGWALVSFAVQNGLVNVSGQGSNPKQSADYANTDPLAVLGFNPSLEWPVNDALPTGYGGLTLSGGATVTRDVTNFRSAPNGVRFDVTTASSNAYFSRTQMFAAPMVSDVIIEGSYDVLLLSKTSGGNPGILIDLLTNAAGTTYQRTRYVGATLDGFNLQQTATSSTLWHTQNFSAASTTGTTIYGIRIYVMGSWTSMNGGGVYGGGTSGGFVGSCVFDNLRLTFKEKITSTNVSTFLADAAIGTAQIDDAAITDAKIGNIIKSSNYERFNMYYDYGRLRTTDYKYNAGVANGYSTGTSEIEGVAGAITGYKALMFKWFGGLTGTSTFGIDALKTYVNCLDWKPVKAGTLLEAHAYIQCLNARVRLYVGFQNTTLTGTPVYLEVTAGLSTMAAPTTTLTSNIADHTHLYGNVTVPVGYTMASLFYSVERTTTTSPDTVLTLNLPYLGKVIDGIAGFSTWPRVDNTGSKGWLINKASSLEMDDALFSGTVYINNLKVGTNTPPHEISLYLNSASAPSEYWENFSVLTSNMTSSTDLLSNAATSLTLTTYTYSYTVPAGITGLSLRLSSWTACTTNLIVEHISMTKSGAELIADRPQAVLAANYGDPSRYIQNFPTRAWGVSQGTVTYPATGEGYAGHEGILVNSLGYMSSPSTVPIFRIAKNTTSDTIGYCSPAALVAPGNVINVTVKARAANVASASGFYIAMDGFSLSRSTGQCIYVGANALSNDIIYAPYEIPPSAPSAILVKGTVDFKLVCSPSSAGVGATVNVDMSEFLVYVYNKTNNSITKLWNTGSEYSGGGPVLPVKVSRNFVNGYVCLKGTIPLSAIIPNNNFSVGDKLVIGCYGSIRAYNFSGATVNFILRENDASTGSPPGTGTQLSVTAYFSENSV